MRHGKLLAAAMLLLAGAPHVSDAQGRAAQAPLRNSAPGRPGDWLDAPEYVRLFAPPRAHTGAYRAFVSPLDVRAVLRQLEHDPALLHPPGAWLPLALLPSEAFGLTGGYERSKLARLYGARRATVARGPRGEGGRPTEAWTLISPYPDRKLERLEPGTLLIVLDLESDTP